MKLIAYSINILMLLSILPFIACGNKQGNVEKQNINIEKQTTDTKPGDKNISDSEKVLQKDYKLQPFEVIIKPSDEQFKDILGDKYKSRTPEVSEIFGAEKLLNECFYDERRGTANHLLDRKAEEYNRQFVGATDSSGDKIIWINCFAKPEKDNDEWKHKLIIAKGGGRNFFNLKANISKNTYYELIVNGDK